LGFSLEAESLLLDLLLELEVGRCSGEGDRGVRGDLLLGRVGLLDEGSLLLLGLDLEGLN
jgi:hypothetical protein